MTSIQIRLSFLLLLLHVSVFAAPVSLRSPSDNVNPSVDSGGVTQVFHAKQERNLMPPGDIALCITTEGIAHSSSNGVPDRSGVSSSLSDLLPLCNHDTGSDLQPAPVVGSVGSHDAFGKLEASLDQFSRGTRTGPTSGVSAVNLGSVGSHSIHVVSGGGSDSPIGKADVQFSQIEGLLEIGSAGPISSGLRPLGQLGVGVPSDDTIPSTGIKPILANSVLSTVNSGILGNRLGNHVPGSIDSQSLNVVSGSGQGSLGSMKVVTPISGGALAIGTGNNDHGVIPAVGEGRQSDSPAHDKPNNGPSSENSNGTRTGQNAPGDHVHGQPNNNSPGNSPTTSQNDGANGQAPPASNKGQNNPSSSAPPNNGPAPDASHSPSNGPNSAPSDGNHAPTRTTNDNGNIAEFNGDVGVPNNSQHLGFSAKVRQRSV